MTIRHPGRSPRFSIETETITIQVQRRFEYDVNFLQDRFVLTARCGDQLGYSAVGLGYGALEEQPDEVAAEIAAMLPEMRRTALDAALGLGLVDEVKSLGRTVREQREEIEFLRRPLRRKAADWLVDFWCQIKAAYA